jgi:F0F1-type ATP synthase assembly protein I
VDLRGFREVNNGFGDGLAAAFELVATPVIFAFFGYLIDRWVGTHLVFALSFGLFVFGYEVWKLLHRYMAEMDAHNASAPWARRPVVEPSESGGADV